MKYLILIQGYDPTGSPTTPTNAELLQMIREAQFAGDVGGIILSETAPDVATYDILRRFRWMEMYGSAPTGNFYYHDGSSWVIERPADGTVTGASIQDGTIGLEKLTPPGVPYYIIQATSTGLALQWISIIDAITDGTLPYAKFVNAAGAGYFFYSGGDGVWSTVNTHNAAGAILGSNGLTAATAFNSTDDIIPFRNSADDEAYGITVANFFKSASQSVPTLGTIAATDQFFIYDASTALIKSIEADNILLPTGVTAGTYVFPASIKVDEFGRVTQISAGTGPSVSVQKASWDVAIPSAAAGTAWSSPVAHGLSGTPSEVYFSLVCISDDVNYVTGDVVPIRNVVAGDHTNPNVSTVSTPVDVFQAIWNDTNIYYSRIATYSLAGVPSVVGSYLWVRQGYDSPPTGWYNRLDETKWQLRITAVYYP